MIIDSNKDYRSGLNIKDEKKKFKIFEFLKDRYDRYFAFPFGIIIFVATFIGLYYAVAAYRKNYIEITEIPFGIGPFQTETRDQLEMHYVYMFKDANDYLRDKGNRYRFFPVVTKQERYTAILTELPNNDGKSIRIASVSPFTFLLFNTGKLEANPKEFVILGYKRVDSKTTYRSRMVWNKKFKFSFQEVIEKIKKSNSYIKKIEDSNIILTREERSTSGHILPEIFLYEQGINIKNRYHLSMNRAEMIYTILNSDSLIIGFISNEDFAEQLSPEKRIKLNYFEIDIPIPNDAFIANKSWWSSLSKKDTCSIIESLRNASMGIVSKKSQDTILYRYNLFKYYVGSGVICIDTIDKNIIDTLVKIPDEQFDILNLTNKWWVGKEDTAFLYNFYVGNKNAMYSTLDAICAGQCILVREDFNTYKIKGKFDIDTLSINQNTIEGLHVLPYQINKNNKNCKTCCCSKFRKVH